MTELVRARWTDQILDECFRNIRINRPDLSDEKLARTRGLMNSAVRDVLVTGFEALIDGVDTLSSNGLPQAVAKLRERFSR